MSEETFDTGTLVDIRIVRVDKKQSRSNRIIDFTRQIKNPYLFKSRKFTVAAIYPNNGVGFEDCLYNIAK